MIVVRARTMGFCAGVRRAVQLAEEAASSSEGRPTYSLGSIVHNRKVTERLSTLGIRVLAEDEIPAQGSVVIIRSHGVPPATIQRLRENGAVIVNATCPKVSANQRTAARLAAAGRKVLIAGDERHGEVLGLAGHAPGSEVVSNRGQALSWRQEGPLALIAQTTLSQAEVDGIASALSANNQDLLVAGGICSATDDRQAALRELLPQVEAVIIVGDPDSANSGRLTTLAREAGKPAWQLATVQELASGRLPIELGRFKCIGLSAGASTPEDDIDEVERYLLKL